MEQKNKKNNNLKVFALDLQAQKESFPLLLTHVAAGFPSPADDYVEQKLDLNEHLVQHPAATFFVRVEGNSMVDAGIQSGDILIVDRAVPVSNGAVVVAHTHGEFTVKRVEQRGNQMYLVPANKNYPPLLVTSEMDVEIWGVVVYVIHKVT
jgi:DNA polymerase V